jgi:hypothetical protein
MLAAESSGSAAQLQLQDDLLKELGFNDRRPCPQQALSCHV